MVETLAIVLPRQEIGDLMVAGERRNHQGQIRETFAELDLKPAVWLSAAGYPDGVTKLKDAKVVRERLALG